MKKWRIARVAVLGMLFFLALSGSADEPMDDHCGVPGFGLATFLFLAGCLFVLTMVASDRFVTRFERDTRPWHRPSLDISPFEKSKPLQFWFFGSLCGFSMGFGLLARMLFTGIGSWTLILIHLCSASGLLAGCYMAIALFRNSFR